jgi:uroporphyrinogen-III synthase/uroporphyrinogen III methyltransferase/synthase
MSAEPLAYKPVIVTRAEAADGPLTTELRTLGLSVLLWPATATTPAHTEGLERALKSIGDFQWIVFASRRAVVPVLAHLPSQPPGLRVAAVGKSTAQVLRQRGWTVDVVPDQAEAGGLVSALAMLATPGMRVLYPASSRALPTIAKGLAQLGAEVTQVEAYRTEPAALDVADCRLWIERDGVAAVTFASPSAVIELQQALGKVDLDRLLSRAPAVAIGPTTARALIERGYAAVVAESATLAGLAATTLRALKTRH